MKEDEIVQPCDGLSNETVTLRIYAPEYKHVRKWMVEFLRKFQNRGIKIARDHVTPLLRDLKWINFNSILRLNEASFMYKICTFQQIQM